MARRAFAAIAAAIIVLAQLPVVAGAAPPAKPPTNRPEVRLPVHADRSEALAKLHPTHDKTTGKPDKVHPVDGRQLPKADTQKGAGSGSGGLGGAGNGRGTGKPDRSNVSAPKGRLGEAAPAPPAPVAPLAPSAAGFSVNFEGVPNVDGVLPPDTNGDIGPNHYMEWVNLSFQVFDRSGTPLLLDGSGNPAPRPGNSLWAGFGGICEESNWGDPIVQYDHLADRWMVSQFALFGADGNHQCIAVSVTPDPTGAWYRYDYLVSATKINDYPKFGVWPDAYYMTVNQFDQDTFAWGGAGVAAFEREAMLTGDPGARMVFFDLFEVNAGLGGMLPADLDSLLPPPAGAPAIFAEVDDDAFNVWPGLGDTLSLWQFHVDWSDPTLSTFGINGLPNQQLPVAPFEAELCGFSRSCIPQPDTDQGLDAISDRLMYRLQYRNFGDHATLVTNHTVDADGNDHAGVRWYELHGDAATSTFGIHDQGTYAPDGDSRWMGSAALDASGNLLLGYSVSSETTYPSIRVAGRLADDPPGTLPQPEVELMAGTGSQTFFDGRWGDYSMMAVDPLDECTFWFTSEYLVVTSVADWHTRIGALKFPSCTTGPRGRVEGTVTRAADSTPLAGARVDVGQASTFTGNDGHYAITVPAATYDLAASAYGYRRVSVPAVQVVADTTVVQDFALEALPEVVVSGTVRDGSGHGWPLYARIDVGGGYPGGPIYTDPQTGTYEVTLFQETPYPFRVQALVPGYLPENRVVEAASATATEDFNLITDAIACVAPGYTALTDGHYQAFPDPYRPTGWLVLNNANGGTTWRFDDPAGRGNLTGGAGSFAVVDSDFAGPEAIQDTELRSPRVNLTGVDEPVVSFRTDFFDYPDTSEVADVDISLDGGDTWANIWHQAGTSQRGPRFVSLPVPDAANQADVRVRFHYFDATFSWWWQVDDVTIGVRRCLPASGGLVLGNVYDANTGAPVDTAVVASVDAPAETATTGPTPADAALDDGFYMLFSSLTGEHPFSATKKNFQPDTRTVDVVADGIVRADFEMAAGQLSAAPSPVEVTVAFGGTALRTITLSNTGAADVAWEAAERNAGREILAPRGALTVEVNGRFSPHRFDPKLGKGKIPKRIVRPHAPPWTDIAAFPTSIMDNAMDVFDGIAYSVGGYDGNGNVAAGFRYDPGTNAWSPITSMANIREKPAAAFVEGRLYVIGGWGNSGDPVPDLEIYDPGADSWSSGASVPVPYAAAVAVALDGQLYVIGGCNAFSCGSTDVFRYDPPTDGWTAVAPYPEPISWQHCAAIEGRIFCAGGVSDQNGESSHAFAYDPAANAWTQLASMPRTAWSGGYVGADGLLLVSGGITDDFQTITNTGFSYDPAADAWSPIPASNNTVYRGGSACGFYKVGGSLGGFNPTDVAEVLPGLTDCGGGVDVTWLSESPVEGVVAAASGGTPGTQDVEIAFDAAVPEVDQPGTYRAFVSFKEDTPYATEPVEVILHVEPAAGTAKLEGTVSGLERCDAPGGPLAGATVAVDGQTSDVVLRTAANGYFTIWMDEANAPLTLTVGAPGHVGQTVEGVSLAAGQTTTQDFALRLDVPCATSSPAAIELTIPQGWQITTTLDLSNAGGAAGYDFGPIAETAFGLSPYPAAPALPATRAFSAPVAEPGAMSVRSQQRIAGLAPVAPALPAWLGMSDLPNGAVRYAHAQCDGDQDHFYVISGVNSFFETTDETWRYDAATDTWTELAPIPGGSEAPTGACYAGRIHVLGGSGSDAHWVYDIAGDSWSAGAPLPRPLAAGAAAGWDGRIYLAGGDDDFSPGNTSGDVDVYDIATDTWAPAAGAPMPVETSFAGYSQAGRYLYVVGGWDDGSPDVNVSAVQRYDLASDTWDVGPVLEPGRSDMALAASDAALYAIGGDADGNGFFDAATSSDRLDLSAWPGGAWAALDPLPMPLVANSAGYCSQAAADGEVWTVGGARVDETHFDITGRVYLHVTGETCPTIRSDVPWLSEDPTGGSIGADGAAAITIGIDASELDPGEHVATIIMPTSDPLVPEIHVPVRVTVTAAPLELTVGSRATIGGLTVEDEDIVSVADDGSATVVFDGSDVGVRNNAIDAFTHLEDGSLVLSFLNNGSVPGIGGSVADSDLVRFVPTSLGATTAGTFSMYFDGSDVGLGGGSEDVDAVDALPDGSLVLSTVGSAKVGSLSAAGQDLLRFVPTSLGATTAGGFSLYLDGSDVGLTTSGENIDAVAVRGDGRVLLSTSGDLAVPGLAAANEDVVVFVPTSLGAATAGSFSSTLRFDGSAFGLASNNVTGIEAP